MSYMNHEDPLRMLGLKCRPNIAGYCIDTYGLAYLQHKLAFNDAHCWLVFELEASMLKLRFVYSQEPAIMQHVGYWF